MKKEARAENMSRHSPATEENKDSNVAIFYTSWLRFTVKKSFFMLVSKRMNAIVKIIYLLPLPWQIVENKNFPSRGVLDLSNGQRFHSSLCKIEGTIKLNK